MSDVDEAPAFTEREQAGRRIAAWLAGVDPAFLVTGPPGAGKSQLASHVAATCDATLLYTHFCRARDDRTIDPVRFVRGLAERLAAAFPQWLRMVEDDQIDRTEISGVATVERAAAGAVIAGVIAEIHVGDVSARLPTQRLVVRPLERLHELGLLPDRLLIVVDGLDEAVNFPTGDTVVDVVASLVGGLPEPVRLLLTSRPDPVVLGRLRMLRPYDLGADDVDVRRYARLRLAALAERPRENWVEAVAEAGAGNFLYARHVLDGLLADAERLAGDPSSTPLPAGLEAYYAEYLDRELSRKDVLWSEIYRPLLQLLVVARGAGLTRAMLADLGGGMPRSRLDDALRRLRQYLAGPWPEGPLRVYHESFREYLTTAENHQVYPEEGELELANFCASAPTSDYARLHRAAHAAAAGRLDELLCDANSLLATDPMSVLTVLEAATSPEGRRAGEAFRRAYDGGAASLHLAALQMGATRLADSLAAMPRRGGWRPSGVWWRSPVPSQTVATLRPAGYSYPPGHPPVSAVETSGGPVAVVAGRNTVECWDLERGRRLAEIGTPAPVRSIVDCGSRDHPLVALCGDAGSITLLSVPSLAVVGRRPGAHPAHVTRAVRLPGHDLLATGDAEGTLALWTLPDLDEVNRRFDAHTLIYNLAAATVGGEELLISGGDRWEVAPGRARDMPSLRVWAVPTLDLRLSESRGDQITHWMGLLRTGDSVVVQARGVSSEISCLEPGASRFRRLDEASGDPHELIQIADGEGMLCSDYDLVPLRARIGRGGPDVVDRGRAAECEPASWAGPVTPRGRGPMLISAGKKLRLWSIGDILDASSAAPPEPMAHRRTSRSITTIAAGYGVLGAGTEGGSLHTWSTGNASGHDEHPLGPSAISAVAVSVQADQLVYVVGTRNGDLMAYAPADRKTLWTVSAGNRVTALTTVDLAGRPVVLAAVDLSGSSYRLEVCRLWDISTGAEINSFDPERDAVTAARQFGHRGDGWRFAAQGYERDKHLTAVVSWPTIRGPVAAASCSNRPVPMWSLGDQLLLDELSVDHRTGAEDLDYGHGCLVAAVGEDLYLWDSADRWSLSVVPAGHRISRIACGAFGDRPCIASGSSDGTLHLSDADGTRLATIDVDERITALAALENGRFGIGTPRGLVVIDTAGQ